MAKGAKRRRLESKAVTHDEVQDQFATSVLFKSNLFKLQTAELLSEVSPFAAGVPLSAQCDARRERRPTQRQDHHDGAARPVPSRATVLLMDFSSH